MKDLSIKTRVMFQAMIISSIVPIVAFLIVTRNNQTAKVYQDIAHVSLEKIEKLGELEANFRQVRVEVRSLAIIDNTLSDQSQFIKQTEKAIESFEKSKKEYAALITTDDEKKQLADLDAKWTDFYEFGKGLLVLATKGDPESIKKLAEAIRVHCPVKKEAVEKIIHIINEKEKATSASLVVAAKESEANTQLFAIIGTLFGIFGAITIGMIFATRVNNSLQKSIESLVKGVSEINKKSQVTSDIASKISFSSNDQASSIQNTVTSIDEISAMVARNADSASSAANNSDVTINSAQKGKEKAEDMLDSIKAISSGNEELINQMEKTNKEISEIVDVIKEISQKTQVINDIVFQTKLLSFNASVEAARAGENGKGFSVVAEEVGNLASMSGSAANEISSMLAKSVSKVNETVQNSKRLMDTMMNQSKLKIESGTRTAQECASSLDEILANASSMGHMVREISNACQEQSVGIREVNKAMNNLDLLSKTNNEVASTSSDTAEKLKEEAGKLGEIVGHLNRLVKGKKAMLSAEVRTHSNVVEIRPKKSLTAIPAQKLKKVAGLEMTPPSSDDSQFEDS